MSIVPQSRPNSSAHSPAVLPAMKLPAEGFVQRPLSKAEVGPKSEEDWARLREPHPEPGPGPVGMQDASHSPVGRVEEPTEHRSMYSPRTRSNDGQAHSTDPPKHQGILQGDPLGAASVTDAATGADAATASARSPPRPVPRMPRQVPGKPLHYRGQAPVPGRSAAEAREAWAVPPTGAEGGELAPRGAEGPAWRPAPPGEVVVAGAPKYFVQRASPSAPSFHRALPLLGPAAHAAPPPASSRLAAGRQDQWRQGAWQPGAAGELAGDAVANQDRGSNLDLLGAHPRVLKSGPPSVSGHRHVLPFAPALNHLGTREVLREALKAAGEADGGGGEAVATRLPELPARELRPQLPHAAPPGAPSASGAGRPALHLPPLGWAPPEASEATGPQPEAGGEDDDEPQLVAAGAGAGAQAQVRAKSVPLYMRMQHQFEVQQKQKLDAAKAQHSELVVQAVPAHFIAARRPGRANSKMQARAGGKRVKAASGGRLRPRAKAAVRPGAAAPDLTPRPPAAAAPKEAAAALPKRPRQKAKDAKQAAAAAATAAAAVGELDADGDGNGGTAEVAGDTPEVCSAAAAVATPQGDDGNGGDAEGMGGAAEAATPVCPDSDAAAACGADEAEDGAKATVVMAAAAAPARDASTGDSAEGLEDADTTQVPGKFPRLEVAEVVLAH